MADKKVREVRPTTMERRKVVIPHYDIGGVVHPGGGGLFGSIGNGISSLAGDFTTQNQYNATLAPTQTSNYGGVIDQAGQNALAGYGTFQNNQGQQADLAAALRGISNGSGPNPAQSMLNNATGANVANQAALIAGQRGAGANVGLQARQAAMAGSSGQQQAAGQAAALESQQQLNALNAQGQVLGQMGNQNISEQGANAGLFGAGAGAQNAQNNSAIQNYNNAQSLNQKSSQSNADATNKTSGGLLNGLGGVASMIPGMGGLGAVFGLAAGGQVPSHLAAVHSIYHADGGVIAPTNTSVSTDTNTVDPKPKLTPEQMKAKEQKLKDAMDPNSTASVGYAEGGIAEDFKGVQRKIGDWATEGKSALQMQADQVNADPRNASPESALPSNTKGTQAGQDYRSGGPVGGVAKVAGNSLENDTQPAMLSPKEIVLPRSVTMAPDAPEKAKAFVEAILKKQGHGNSKHHKEFHKALRAAILSRKS